MTEFEMAYLFNDMHIALLAQMSLSVSALSGFLVASYVAAHRLTNTMAAMSVGLYSWFSFVFAVLGFRTAASYSGIMGQMRAFKDAGKGLDWHFATKTPEWTLDFIPFGGVMIAVVVYAASLFFFFHCRRVNRIAETVATPVAATA